MRTHVIRAITTVFIIVLGYISWPWIYGWWVVSGRVEGMKQVSHVWAFFGILIPLAFVVAAALVPFFLRGPAYPGVVTRDERDQLIAACATRWAGVASTGVAILYSLWKRVSYCIQYREEIDVDHLALIAATVLATFLVVRSVSLAVLHVRDQV